MITKRMILKQVQTIYFNFSNMLLSVIMGILFLLASNAQAKTFPVDPLPKPPSESVGWKYTELITKNTSNAPDYGYKHDITTRSDGTIFVAWVKANLSGNSLSRQLFFSQRPAGSGEAWSTPKLITTTEYPQEGIDYPPCPSLTSDSKNTVHIVWSVNRRDDPTDSIYYSKYNAKTKIWDPAIKLVNQGHIVGCPKLLTDSSDNLHLVWTEPKGVYYQRYVKKLNGWLDPVLISNKKSGYSAPGMSIGKGGSVHVVWINSDGFYYRKHNPGVPWSEIQLVEKNKLIDYKYSLVDVSPSVAADKKGNVHFSWAQIKNSKETRILYKRYSAISGWSDIKTISNKGGGHSTAPSLAITTSISKNHKEVLHIVWMELTGNRGSYTNRIWYKNFDILLKVWSEPSEVQEYDDYFQASPQWWNELSRTAVSVDSDRYRGTTVHTVWASGSDVDIFYSRYVNTPEVVMKKVIYPRKLY